MDIFFTGHNIELTPALKAYAEEKMQRLEHRDHDILKIQISLHLQNVTHVADATIHLRGRELHAEAQSNDMYSAIDLLADKLKALITKHKEKLDDHR